MKYEKVVCGRFGERVNRVTNSWSETMRKLRIWAWGVIILSLLAGCSNQDVESSAKPSSAVKKNMEVEFTRLESVFGFADESGEKLITIPDDSGAGLDDPEQFNAAIGNNGEWVEIEFVHRQKANEQDNNRQTMYNFNNMAGDVYKAKNGKFIQNESYLLTRDGVMDKNSLMTLNSTVDGQSQTGEGLFAGGCGNDSANRSEQKTKSHSKQLAVRIGGK
ncbi:hypothetical protein [Paenibacillus sp. TH7-28]